MKLVRFVVVAGLCLFVAIVISRGNGDHTSGATATTTTETRPGAQSVYDEIAASTSCARLHEMFDTAYSNNRREQAGTSLYDATLDYMTEADARMNDIGCYS